MSLGTSPTGSSADAPPQVEFGDLPDRHIVVAVWATELFDAAGLGLPPLRFDYHGGATEPCGGRAGMHHAVGATNVIEICTTEITPATEALIVHEVAHAWLDRSLSDERKAAFRELRGWTYWRNYEAAAWHENGTEQAAEIVMWGVIDRPVELIRITQNSHDELVAGYRTLTGLDPGGSWDRAPA